MEQRGNMSNKKIRVTMGGIHYPLSMMSWFIRAFRQRKDIDLWLFGPFSGTYTPWMYGIHMPQKYVVTPDFPLPQQSIQQSISSAIINAQMPWIPDITIQIDAGWHLADRPAGNIVVHIQTDPHVLKPYYALPKSYSDINFCMQLQYSEVGEIYLPYAADETVCYPMPEVDKIYDACLIGLQYPTRNSLVQRLQSHGLSVKYETGLIFDEYRMAYNQSKIALNWSTLEDVPCRFFEGMAMGLPMVSNIVPDMEKLGFIEGTDYFGFRSLDEADGKVKQLLIDEGLRCWVAENGYRKVMEKHLWKYRIEQILKEANLI
jgi:hypothetical protein